MHFKEIFVHFHSFTFAKKRFIWKASERVKPLSANKLRPILVRINYDNAREARKNISAFL